VTFQVIFLGGFRVTFQVIQEGVILEKVPSVQWKSYTVIWAILSWGLRG